MFKKIKEILSIILFLLFYPITGLIDTYEEAKKNDIYEFTDIYGYYLLFCFFWICTIGILGIIVGSLINDFIVTICYLASILLLVFVVVVVPDIIHKIANRK